MEWVLLFSFFTDEKTEAERDQVTCSRVPFTVQCDRNLNLRLPHSKLVLLIYALLPFLMVISHSF